MLTLSLIARLPLAMFSIGLLVHAEHLTGSFAVAGLVTGAYAIALGCGGPVLGRSVDRRGQTAVLVSAATASAALLAAISLLPAGAPPAFLLALAAGLGFATPPVGACVRTLLDDPRAFALEASAVELTWVFGPPLALAGGALVSTGAALAGAGAILLAGTLAFAAHPGSRAWRPTGVERPRGGALRTGPMRTLVLVLGCVGAVFGSVEIGVAAAADEAVAGALLGVWGAGSLAGGLWLARRGGAAKLGPLLAALAAGHGALVLVTGNVWLLAAGLALAGAAIAPTYATVYALVERAAPAGTVTEAFAWLATAVAVGAASGSAVAGALAEASGPTAAFLLAGAAAACALLATAARPAVHVSLTTA